MRLQAPAPHLAAEQVDDYSQVQSALVSGDVGDVSTPQLVGCLGGKAPLHQGWCHRQTVAAVGGDHKLALGSERTPCCSQLAHLVPGHPGALGQQFLVHPRPALFPLDFSVDGADVSQQSFNAVAPAGAASHVLWAAQPVEVAAGADLQHVAGDAHRVLLPHLLNSGVPRSVSCAKYAAAQYFAMWRSIRSRATFARKCAISICSGETRAAWSTPPALLNTSLAA